jgi:hypothetical protein
VALVALRVVIQFFHLLLQPAVALETEFQAVLVVVHVRLLVLALVALERLTKVEQAVQALSLGEHHQVQVVVAVQIL